MENQNQNENSLTVQVDKFDNVELLLTAQVKQKISLKPKKCSMQIGEVVRAAYVGTDEIDGETGIWYAHSFFISKDGNAEAVYFSGAFFNNLCKRLTPGEVVEIEFHGLFPNKSGVGSYNSYTASKLIL